MSRAELIPFALAACRRRPGWAQARLLVECVAGRSGTTAIMRQGYWTAPLRLGDPRRSGPVVKMAGAGSAGGARLGGVDRSLHLRAAGHGSIPWGGHGQGAQGAPVVNRGLGPEPLKQGEHQARGETVASARAVKDIQVVAPSRLVELALSPQDSAPVVAVGAFRAMQGAGDHPMRLGAVGKGLKEEGLWE